MRLPKAHNPLAIHCRKTETSITELATILGVQESAARFYLLPLDDSKYRMPPLKRQYRIFKWSGGAVRPNDMVPMRLWEDELARELSCGVAA